MPGPWTYLACELLTDRVLAELPLSNVTFSDPLNAPGRLNAELPLTTGRNVTDLLEATDPWRTCIYVSHTQGDGPAATTRTGWGGIWTARSYDSKTQKLTVEAQQFDAYLSRRRLTEKHSYNTDQFTIVRALVDYAQAKPGGNIGIDTSDTTLSGVTRHVDYPKLQEILQAVQDMSALDGGFDYTVEMRDRTDRETPDKILLLSYPRRGRHPFDTGLVIVYPGSDITYTWPEDPSGFTTDIWATGSGYGDAILTSHASTPVLIDDGYPLLEQVPSYPDITRQVNLDARARADAQAARMLKTLPTFTLPPDGDPAYGRYITGDYVRLLVSDPVRFPAGLDTSIRITQVDVKASAGNQPDQVTLTLDPAA